MTHLGTHIAASCYEDRPLAGQTAWVSQDEQGEWGLAWDWVELSPGVLAMADPMAVVSNLQLVGEAGEPLPQAQVARLLSSLVHALPWRSEVERAMSLQLQ